MNFSDNVYHERQSLWRCGLHTVNNLLQKQVYTEQSFQRIADELRRQTGYSHLSSLGVGNYDINVIEAALVEQGMHLKWFDQGRYPLANVLELPTTTTSLDNIHQPNTTLIGLIINVRNPSGLLSMCSPARGDHFFALRKIYFSATVSPTFHEKKSNHHTIHTQQYLWVNLDSKLSSWETFPDNQAVIQFLYNLKSRRDPYILQVYSVDEQCT